MSKYKILHLLSGEYFITDELKDNVTLDKFKKEFEIVMENYLTTPIFNEDGNCLDSEKEAICHKLVGETLYNDPEYVDEWYYSFIDFLIQNVTEDDDKRYETLLIAEFEIIEVEV